MGDIKLGLTSLSDIKFGNNQASFVYLGTNLVWSKSSYILDLYGSAHHAYSLRKLRDTYTGFCLRIRRTTSTPSVTTTTVDVSFNSSNTVGLDSAITYVSGTATSATNLGQFCASIINGYTNPDGVNTNQNIFITTWFDQSGNGKNTAQATASRQPRLVNLGNLETSGGKVAIRFTRASFQSLSIVDSTANINNMSTYFVGAFLTATTTQIGYLLNATNRFYFPIWNGSGIYAGYGSAPNAILLDSAIDTSRKLYELLAPSPLNSSVAQGWTNGVEKGTRALLSSAINTIEIGTGSTNYFDGHIQEIIGYQSNASRLEKETNINNYWTIY